MTQVIHKVVLQSDHDFGSRLPPHHLGFFLAEIPVAVEQSISMALRNRSSSAGRHPQWLDRAADIRFVHHEGYGSSTLFFEAPTLGESAQEIYQQAEIWPTRPAPDDTGFDLLGNVLADVAANNADSAPSALFFRRFPRAKYSDSRLAGNGASRNKNRFANCSSSWCGSRRVRPRSSPHTRRCISRINGKGSARVKTICGSQLAREPPTPYF